MVSQRVGVQCYDEVVKSEVCHLATANWSSRTPLASSKMRKAKVRGNDTKTFTWERFEAIRILVFLCRS